MSHFDHEPTMELTPNFPKVHLRANILMSIDNSRSLIRYPVRSIPGEPANSSFCIMINILAGSRGELNVRLRNFGNLFVGKSLCNRTILWIRRVKIFALKVSLNGIVVTLKSRSKKTGGAEKAKILLGAWGGDRLWWGESSSVYKERRYHRGESPAINAQYLYRPSSIIYFPNGNKFIMIWMRQILTDDQSWCFESL